MIIYLSVILSVVVSWAVYRRIRESTPEPFEPDLIDLTDYARQLNASAAAGGTLMPVRPIPERLDREWTYTEMKVMVGNRTQADYIYRRAKHEAE